MRHFHLTFLVIFSLSFSLHAQSQDTLVDVGGYKMYEKSIELNPENENGKTVLRQMKQE